MRTESTHSILTYLIATVWLVNGLFCKVLNLVPRHEQIVLGILGSEYAGFLTKSIGFAEIVMAIWILIGIRSRLNALVQILIIGLMNVLELVFVPELLLWGKINIVFALLFMVIIYWNGFVLNQKIAQQY